jgi:hypothetical protein
MAIPPIGGGSLLSATCFFRERRLAFNQWPQRHPVRRLDSVAEAVGTHLWGVYLMWAFIFLLLAFKLL